MGIIFLHVRVEPDGRNVACWFRSRRGGTRSWMFVVDRFAELAEEVTEGTAMAATYPDAPEMLGRGARVVMPRWLYIHARVRLELDDEASAALRDGSFVIDDVHVAPKLVLNLARAYFVRSANEPWLIGRTGTDRS
jgi:hypothetical protein